MDRHGNPLPARSRRSSIRAHLPALIGAAAADDGNVGVTELFARLCAGFADLRAGAAGNVVQMRVPNHEVVRREANLRAVQQVADVMRVSMDAAFFEAIVNRVQAGVAAVFAGVNARMHFGRLMFMDVRHRNQFWSVLFVDRKRSSLRFEKGLVAACEKRQCSKSMIRRPSRQSIPPSTPLSYFSSQASFSFSIPASVSQVKTIIPATVAMERMAVSRKKPLQP